MPLKKDSPKVFGPFYDGSFFTPTLLPSDVVGQHVVISGIPQPLVFDVIC